MTPNHEKNMSTLPKLLRDLPKFSGPFDAHKHDAENAGIITKGVLVLTMDGRETGFGLGDW